MDTRSGGNGEGKEGSVHTCRHTTSLVVCQLSSVNLNATAFSKATFLTRIEPRNVGGRVRGKTRVST